MLQADGGTRTAAITGSMRRSTCAVPGMVKSGNLTAVPLTDRSPGCAGLTRVRRCSISTIPRISTAQADANFVLTGWGASSRSRHREEKPFGQAEFPELLALARKGIPTDHAAEGRARL